MADENESDTKPGRSQEEVSDIKGGGDHFELEQWAENIVEAFNLQKKQEEMESHAKHQGEDNQKEKDNSNRLEEDYGFQYAGLFLDNLQVGQGQGRYFDEEEDKCDYCDNKDNYFYETTQMVRRLYDKYASSQNYYYTRDINEILCNGRTHTVIEFKDIQTADYEAEYLKRFYPAQDYQRKASQIMEYYKFHKNLPRLFMLPETAELNRYHEKKGRYDYYRILQLIEEENAKNPQRPPKGIVGEKPPLRTYESSGPRSEDDGEDEEQLKNTEGAQIVDNLLEDISSFNFKSLQSQQDEGKNYERQNNFEDCGAKVADLNVEVDQFKVNQQLNSQRYSRGTEKENEKITQNNKPRTSLKKDEQQSLTLQELNLKLEEIVTNQSQINLSTFSISKINEEKNKYFDGKDLDNFLAFLNGNKQLQKINIKQGTQNNLKLSSQQGLTLKQADNQVNCNNPNYQLTVSNFTKNKLPFQGLIDQQIQNSNLNFIRQNNQENNGQDMKKLNTAPLAGQIIKVTNEDLQSNTVQTTNTLQTVRDINSQNYVGQLDTNNVKKNIENQNQPQQIIDNKTPQQKQQTKQYPQKRVNLQLKLDDIDFNTVDNKNHIGLKSNDNDFAQNIHQGIASTLSVRSAKEMIVLQEGCQSNNTGPLSCSAALIQNNLKKSTSQNNASPFFKNETNCGNTNKGNQGKLTSPNSGLIGNNKSPKQIGFNFNIEKPQELQQQSSSPQPSSTQMKLIGNQQLSSAQVSKQIVSSSSKQSQQLQQKMQLQQQLLQSSNSIAKNAQLSSTSQNSFALKLDTKESQLFTPRQPQPQPSQLIQGMSTDSSKIPLGIKQLAQSSKPQISPRGIVSSPKNLELKDKQFKKNQLINQQQQQMQQQQLQQFQQQLHANTAALLRKSSSNNITSINTNNNNNNLKINPNSLQKKNSQQLPVDSRQSSKQSSNDNNQKTQKGQSSWKQLNLKLKLDLLDNSKEKSSQIILNNSSSQNTFPANLHNSNNSNTPYLKDPLSQRSCSSKNMEQSTTKYNFYEMFKQQVASHAYTTGTQNNNNNNNNNNAKNAKGSALHMLNLINAQQAQSRALAQAQQNQQQPPPPSSSSPTNRSSKQTANVIQPPGFLLQATTKQTSNQPQVDLICENQSQSPQFQVQSKISPRSSSQKDKSNCLKYVLPEEKNPLFNNNQQIQSCLSSSPLQQVLSVKVVKQSKKQDNLTFNQTGNGKGSKSNKNSLDQTSQRKVVSIAPSFTARSENHTRKQSQTQNTNNKFTLENSLQQQQASIVAAFADCSKQASRNSSIEINSQNPSFLRKKSPQFFKGDSNEISKNVCYLNSNQIPISVSSARNYKQDGIPHTIPLPKPELGGGANSGRGQLSAYHQPRPLISQAQMQLPSGQFYDLSNQESGGIPNTTGLVSNSISRLQQSGINLNAGISKTGNQSNMIFNSSQIPSNSALGSFAILNNISTTNHYLDQYQPYVQQQQQPCISQRILQNATSRQQALKLQQQQQQLPQSTKYQPYSHLWQSPSQDQLNSQVQQQIFAFNPQSSTNLANFQPSASPYLTNSGSLSVRVNPNGNGLAGTATKLNSPKTAKKVLSLHKHTKSENLLNLLSHSDANLVQNQLSSQTSYVPASKKSTKHQSNVLSSDTTKQQQQQQQPANLQSASQFAGTNSPNIVSMIAENNNTNISSCASFQPINFNFLQSNTINNHNNCDNMHSNIIQEKQLSNPTGSNSDVISALVGSSHLITPRVPSNPRREGISEKTKREMNQKQSLASPLSTRSGQINFQREQFRSTNNSTNNNTSSQNNNNMHNPSSSSNNNSSSHQANSSLNQQQPSTTTQPHSFTQLPPQTSSTSSGITKSVMGGQISSLFTVSPSARNGQISGSNQTSVLPASFIGSKKTKKKSMF